MSKDIQNKLAQMKQPTQLLKFGMSGKPKFTSFQLSNDASMITWVSQKKDASQTRVLVRLIKEFKFGQRTEKFKRNPRTDLQHLSFSICYCVEGDDSVETLDLVCKDDKEFETWTSGILFLMEASDSSKSSLVASAAFLIPQLPRSSGTADLLTSSVRNDRAITTASVISGFAENPDDVKQAFQEANDVYSCGWGDWGQGGLIEMVNERTPQLVKCLLGKGVMRIACGWSHSAVELETGQLAMFGNRLGTGNSKDTMLPLMITMPFRCRIDSISCGSFHSAVLNELGQIFTWGCNFNGQLGLGHFNDVLTPTLVSTFSEEGSRISTIVCSATTTACIAASGDLYTWGCGSNGALGHNDTTDRNIPTLVQDLQGTRIIQLACGEAHMLAVSDDLFFVWGWNACGQLGLGHQDDVLRPTNLETLGRQRVVAVAAGSCHSLAVVSVPKLQTTAVYVWGSNLAGQLGLPDKRGIVSKPMVTSVANEEISDVSCGSHHSVLLTVNGEILTSGSNEYGQLCNADSLAEQSEFKIVESLRGRMIRAISSCGGLTSVLVARAWVADSEAKECMACKNSFTMLNRRHHCRSCGGLFCNSCSSKKAAILKYGLVEPVRVCDSCYTKITGQR